MSRRILAILIYLCFAGALASRPTLLPFVASEWPSYETLRDCVKWCLSACKKIDDNCTPPVVDATFDTFPSRLGCRVPACLCEGDAVFSQRLNNIDECANEYCELGPCQSERERIVKIFGNYCRKAGINPQTFPLSLNATSPDLQTCTTSVSATATAKAPSSTTQDNDHLTVDGKVAIGVSVAIGVPALIANVYMVFLAVKSWNKQKNAAAVSSQPAESYEMGELPPQSVVQPNGLRRTASPPPSSDETSIRQVEVRVDDELDHTALSTGPSNTILAKI